LIRTTEKILPAFLAVYLNSYYGRNCLWYLSRQTEQVNLNCREVEQLLVLNASKHFQSLIDKIHNQSSVLKEKSNEIYREAEQNLLSELGLFKWKPKHQLSFVKNFSDTKSVDRIDAEYFQPIYDELIKKIKQYRIGYKTLGELVFIRKCIEPGSEAYQENGIPFLRVSNLSKFCINRDNMQYLSESLYEQLKTHNPRKGEILLSKDATPGIACYLNNEPEKMIPSSGILRLKVKDINSIYSEYLTLVLNSVVVQKQIERDAGGSVINHWLVDQVKKTLIPVLPDSIQKEVSDKIADSFMRREQSENLLDIAKRGVEMAIEKDEEEATKWLTKEERQVIEASLVSKS